MNDVKYPDIEVELTGTDGNPVAIFMKVRRALERNHVPADEVEKFMTEVTSGDYDNVITTCMRWVNVS